MLQSKEKEQSKKVFHHVMENKILDNVDDILSLTKTKRARRTVQDHVLKS